MSDVSPGLIYLHVTPFTRGRRSTTLASVVLLSVTCAYDAAFADHCIAVRAPYINQMQHGPDWSGSGKTSCSQIDVYIANDEIYMSQVRNQPDCQHGRTMADPVLSSAVNMTVNRLRKLRQRKAEQCTGGRDAGSTSSNDAGGLDPMSCIRLRQTGYRDLYLHARLYNQCSYKVTAFVKECDGEGTDHLICKTRPHNVTSGGQSDDISSERIEPKLVGAVAVGRR